MRRRNLYLSFLMLVLGLFLAACGGQMTPEELDAEAAGDRRLAGGSLAQGVQDWSWGTDVVYGLEVDGRSALSATYKKGWAAYSLRLGQAAQTNDYGGIAVTLKGSGQKLALSVRDSSGKVYPSFRFTARANFTKVCVSWRDLGSPSDVDRIDLQEKSGEAQKAIYVDNLSFYKSCGGSGSAPAPQPTPKPESGETIKAVYFGGPNLSYTGTYTSARFRDDWGDIWQSNGVKNGNGQIVPRGNYRALKVKLPAGSPGNGGNHFGAYIADYKFGGRSDVTLTYWTKFENGFNFVRGGKLPGLSSGTKPSGGVSPSERANGFSTRIMWRENGRAVAYVYYPQQPCGETCYGEDMQLRWSNGDNVSFKPGQWYRVTVRVKLGTRNQTNGKLQVWLKGDGRDERVLDKNMMWQTSRSHSVNHLMLHTFFGGGDSSWAPAKDEYVYLDNFILKAN